MKSFVFLCAFAAMVFAADDTLTGQAVGTGYSLPGNDDSYDSYAYNNDEILSSIPASFTDYAVVDDFVHSGFTYIETYTTWGVTTGAAPTALEVLVVTDSSGPDGAPVSMNSYPCTATDSGFTFAGYTVWLVSIDLYSIPITIPSGLTVWLGTHRNDGVTWYPACGATVTGMEAYRTVAAGWAWEPISASIESGDLFKVLVLWTALERSTWASIKNSF